MMVAVSLRQDPFQWTAGIYGVLAISAFLSWLYWEDLHSDQESLSATIRNIGLIVGGIVAMILAVWRSTVAERQADTAQQSLLNERYQRAAEMLGSEVLSVRLAGIYALERLATEHPEQYHVQVMKQLCAFVCHPPAEVASIQENEDGMYGASHHTLRRADVQEAMKVIGARNEVHINLERLAAYKLDLHGAQLQNQILSELNLSGVQLESANLSGAFVFGTNLSSANLFGAVLPGAKFALSNFSKARLQAADLSAVQAIGIDFSDADLSSANLTDANLSGAKLYGTVFMGTNLANALFFENGLLAEGLTMKQIIFAKADPEGKPPCLDGLEDYETGEMIFWDKRPRPV